MWSDGVETFIWVKMVSEETKNSAKTKIYREIPIKNPFIRENKIWDSENELFDKIKVSLSHDVT